MSILETGYEVSLHQNTTITQLLIDTSFLHKHHFNIILAKWRLSTCTIHTRVQVTVNQRDFSRGREFSGHIFKLLITIWLKVNRSDMLYDVFEFYTLSRKQEWEKKATWTTVRKTKWPKEWKHSLSHVLETPWSHCIDYVLRVGRAVYQKMAAPSCLCHLKIRVGESFSMTLTSKCSPFMFKARDWEYSKLKELGNLTNHSKQF